MPALNTLRLVGSGGANRAMEAEVKRLAPRALGARARELQKPTRVDEQTLVYPYDDDFAWLLVNHHRTASRILRDLFSANAGRLEPLYDEVVAWIAGDRGQRWFADGMSLSVRAREIRDFPASASQIQGTIKNAVIEGAKQQGMTLRLDPEAPDILLSVRGTGGPLVISLDLAGRSLHERGYRLDKSEAPLRENLAAQMLILSRWDSRSEVLIDPMCGSGTILIEGAMSALGAPLWVDGRRPAADRMPAFSGRAATLAPLYADAQPMIIGNDIHTPALEAADANLKRAGVADRVLSLHGDFRALTQERLRREIERHAPPSWPKDPLSRLDRGLIIANPPYGERIESRGTPKAEELSGAGLTQLYTDLRDWCLSLGPGWRAAFLVANPEFEEIFGDRPALKKPMANGPLKAQFYVYEQ